MSEVTIRRAQDRDGTVRVRWDQSTANNNADYYTAHATGSIYDTVSFGFISQHVMMVVTAGDIGVFSWSWGDGTTYGQLGPGEDITKDGMARSTISTKSNSNAGTVARIWAW